MRLGKVNSSHIRAVTGTTFVATLSSLLFGYCTAVIAGAVGAIDHNFILPRNLTGNAANALLGLTVCSALVGTILGALLARPAASLLGRKKPMILAAVLFVVSAVGSAYPELGIAPIGDMGPAAIWPFNFYRMLGGIAVGLASMRDLGVTDDIVNVNGGAIALGHPIGMSGARIAITLVNELRRRGGGLGAAALCGGGGQGDAAIIRAL